MDKVQSKMEKDHRQWYKVACKLEREAARLRLYLAGRAQKNAAADTPQMRKLAQNAVKAAEQLYELIKKEA